MYNFNLLKQRKIKSIFVVLTLFALSKVLSDNPFCENVHPVGSIGAYNYISPGCRRPRCAQNINGAAEWFASRYSYNTTTFAIQVKSHRLSN